MVTALFCSNHVTYRCGKGMMPKAYRLNMNSMAVIMDNYAKYVSSSLKSTRAYTDVTRSQLAEQYGNDVASEVLARSRSNLQLDAMPTMPYSTSQQSSYVGKYETLSSAKVPESQ